MDLECPTSLLLFFPEDLYRNLGSSAVLPQVLEVIGEDNLVAVQFLRGGVVRLTFIDEAVCDDFFEHGFDYDGVPLRVTRASSNVRTVYLRDLPIEVPEDVVTGFFSSYGQVVSVACSKFKDFPTLCDGTRIVKIVLKSDVPYFVRISDFDCRVWYSRQPPQCSICRECGHRARECPLSGLCRRCRQPGHTARECTRAWGPSAQPADVVSADGEFPDDVSDVPADVPVDVPTVAMVTDVPVPLSTAAPVAVPSSVPSSTVVPVTVPLSVPMSTATPVTSVPSSVPSSAVAAPVPSPAVDPSSAAASVTPVSPASSVSSAASSVSSRRKVSPYEQFFLWSNPSPVMVEVRNLVPKVPRLHNVISRVGHVLNNNALKQCKEKPNSMAFVSYFERFADQYCKTHRKT